MMPLRARNARRAFWYSYFSLEQILYQEKWITQLKPHHTNSLCCKQVNNSKDIDKWLFTFWKMLTLKIVSMLNTSKKCFQHPYLQE